jgi:CubicO group peptidase (beta-lactamase class C family)
MQRQTLTIRMRGFGMLFVILTVTIVTSFSQEEQTEVSRLVSILSNKGEARASRLKAAERLGALGSGDTAAISCLIGCFSDSDPFLNGQSATSLGQIGGAAVPWLIKALQAPIENVRWCAAISLGKIGPDAGDAIPTLIAALNDSSANVRWCSAIALGNMGHRAEPAAQALRSLLMDDDEDVRWAAYYASGKIDAGRVGRRLALDAVIAVVDSLMPRLMKEHHVPGVSVAIVDKRTTAWEKSYGLKDTRTSEPVTDQTVFEACSMSKPVLAYLAMRLVDDKALDLDRPLQGYLPESFVSTGDYGRRLTARMVLSHTGGFPNWRKGEEETGGPLPIYFLPGTRFSYSGEGFYYLQRVIEKLTREPLDVYAKIRLFDPLGLKHTSYVWTSDIGQFQASGHDTMGRVLTRTQYVHPNAAYTLYTSAEDYAKIISSILAANRGDEHSLSPGSVKEMMTHQVQVDVRAPVRRPGRALGLGVYWGLGWAVDSTISGNIIYHSGANRSGFRCYSQFNYEQGSGIVIMTNGLNGSELWRRVVEKVGDF